MKVRGLLCAGWLMWAGAAAADGTPSAPAEDIRDIRGPGPAATTLPWPALAAGAALVAGLAYAAYRGRRRQKAAPAPWPHQWALQRLEALRAQMPGLATQSFAIAASGIIRSYIEARFGVAVTRRTTEEFMQDLLASADATLQEHRPLLEEFLRRCDYAKFAGSSVGPESLESMYRGAHAFVTQTAPREPHDPVSAT